MAAIPLANAKARSAPCMKISILLALKGYQQSGFINNVIIGYQTNTTETNLDVSKLLLKLGAGWVARACIVKGTKCRGAGLLKRG
jgi:hypothetical protein